MTLKSHRYLPLGFIALIFYALALYQFSSPAVALPSQNASICLYSNQADDDLRKTFTEAILQAKKSITCIIYSLSDAEIIQALKLQADRGITTKVICDAVATQGVQKKLGKNVQLFPVRQKGLMHNKLLSIDENVAWLGSCNFTRDSLLCHANLVAGISSESIAYAIEKKALALQENKNSKIAPISVQLPDQHLDFHFLPDDKQVLSKVLKLLQSAKKSVKVAMFTFTHNELIQQLIDLHRKGINVQIVLDNDSSRKTSKIALNRFKAEKMDVRTSMRSGLLHEKIAIIDDEILIGGSTNWTKAAFTANDEHLFILYNVNSEQREKLATFWQTTLTESTSIQ